MVSSPPLTGQIGDNAVTAIGSRIAMAAGNASRDDSVTIEGHSQRT
jgi:hypothetical protein